MLRPGNANAIVIQGLIAQEGFNFLEFENKPEEGGGEGEGGEEKH